MHRCIGNGLRVFLAGLLMLALLVAPVVPAGAHPAASMAHPDATASTVHDVNSACADGVTDACPAPATGKADAAACCVSPSCVPALAGLPAAHGLTTPARTSTRLVPARAGLPDGIGVAPALPPPRTA